MFLSLHTVTCYFALLDIILFQISSFRAMTIPFVNEVCLQCFNIFRVCRWYYSTLVFLTFRRRATDHTVSVFSSSFFVSQCFHKYIDFECATSVRRAHFEIYHLFIADDTVIVYTAIKFHFKLPCTALMWHFGIFAVSSYTRRFPHNKLALFDA